MPARNAEAPTREEIQAFALGKLDAPRAREIELYLAEHLELVAVLEATPDDEVVRPLRGARVVAASASGDQVLPGRLAVAGAEAGARESGALDASGRRIVVASPGSALRL